MTFLSSYLRIKRMTKTRERGFSLLEVTIVLAIILVIGAMTAPRILRAMEFQKMQLAAQDYAGLLQTARARASQDYTWYEVQTTNASCLQQDRKSTRLNSSHP